MTQTTIDLTPELAEAVDQAANECGLDRDGMIIDLIRFGLVHVSAERFNKKNEELRQLDRERAKRGPLNHGTATLEDLERLAEKNGWKLS
jgi:hypothetical protein